MGVSAIIYKRNSKATIWLVFAVCVLFYACKEKYLAPINDVNPNYLVVDGFINTGGDSTVFKLSRTFKLESKAVMSPEKAAIVTVEKEGGGSYVLPELALKSGTYAAPPLNLDQSKKYRLRIRTKDNKEYLSEFVESKLSPPVDITHDFRHNELNVYANSADPSGNSHYYNYTYNETWQYQSKLESHLKIENHVIKDRILPQEDIFNCYHNAASTKITLASTDALTEDRVADFPIVNIAGTSGKLQIEYSILVKQSVLSKAGFEFYSNLKKNNESVGNIFDAQPSQLNGNIKCTTNASETVLGFVSAGTITSKRFTIIINETPFSYQGNLPEPACDSSVVKFLTFPGFDLKQELLDPNKPEYLVLDVVYGPAGPAYYTASKRWDCIDCRLKGGTNVMPPYWRH